MHEDRNTTTGEVPALPEDTLDLAVRLDPVRALLRRAADGEDRARRALIDLLAPRVHGLALHITGSPRRARRVSTAALRGCLEDAAALSTGGLPGDVAVLDRARRLAVPLAGSGPIRSVATEDPAQAERTRDTREVEVIRALLSLPADDRAVVEAAAQGRSAEDGPDRVETARVLARALDALLPVGDLGDLDVRIPALVALDAFGIADASERELLRTLATTPESAALHRHGIEAVARLALLTAAQPPADLTEAVLSELPAPEEAPYRGTYATPVLGVATQQRHVGPPARAGATARRAPSDAAQSGPSPSPAPFAQSPGAPGTAASSATAQEPPSYQFSRADEARRRRRERRRARNVEGAPAPWFSRGLAALALVAVAVLSGLLVSARGDQREAEALIDAWSSMSTAEDAVLVDGATDNGTWQAAFSEGQAVLHAEDVAETEGYVMNLWGLRGDEVINLGIITFDEGSVDMHVSEDVDELLVTRENAPGNTSGTPSDRTVVSLKSAPPADSGS